MMTPLPPELFDAQQRANEHEHGDDSDPEPVSALPHAFPRWQRIAGGVLLVVTLILVGYIVILSRNGFSAEKVTRVSAGQTACFSAINAARGDVVAQVTIDKATADEAFYTLILGLQAGPGEPPDAAAFATFSGATSQLGKSVKAAKQLPSRDQLVHHGGDIVSVTDAGVFATVHYQPCPKV